MTEIKRPKTDASTNIATPPDVTACAMGDFYRAEGYKPNESIGYLMRRIISLVSQGVERELEPKGLTNAQWVPLLKLYMGQASTVAELARNCDLDAGSMTRLLDRLEAKELVRRVRSSDDRRVVNLELTEAGKLAAREIPEVLCRVQNAHLAGFSTGEWQVLKSFLRRILDNAQSLSLAASKPADAPATTPGTTPTTTPTTTPIATPTDSRTASAKKSRLAS